MVLGSSRGKTNKGVRVSSVTVAAAAAIPLTIILSGGDGRMTAGIIFVEGSTGSGRTGPLFAGGGGGGFWATGTPSNVGIAVVVTAMAGLALAATLVYNRRGSLRSPWSRRRRRHALLPKQWKSLFNSDGRLCDGGVKFLKKVRNGGVDPSIRAEVWPFLLGVYAFVSASCFLFSYISYDNMPFIWSPAKVLLKAWTLRLQSLQ